jgi:hypothetical protein
MNAIKILLLIGLTAFFSAIVIMAGIVLIPAVTIARAAAFGLGF